MTRPTKDEMMMCMAIVLSRMSTCHRLQVGAVVTDEDYRQIAIGYNGGYRGGPNECLRPTQGGCGCVHAEVNALLKTTFKPHYLFVTDSPCEFCAAAMVNSGVKEVAFARPYRLDAGVELLRSAGVVLNAMEPMKLNQEMLTHFNISLVSRPYSWRLE